MLWLFINVTHSCRIKVWLKEVYKKNQTGPKLFNGSIQKYRICIIDAWQKWFLFCSYIHVSHITFSVIFASLGFMLLCMKDSFTSYYNFVSMSECQTFNQHSNTLQFIQEISIRQTVFALNMCDVILDMYQYITLLFDAYMSNHFYGGLNSTKLFLQL